MITLIIQWVVIIRKMIDVTIILHSLEVSLSLGCPFVIKLFTFSFNQTDTSLGSGETNGDIARIELWDIGALL